MSRIHPLLLLAALPLVACSDDGDDTPVPEGPHYKYVVSEVKVPTSNTQSRDYGLDLTGDGATDNVLGMVLSTLAGMGFALQTSVDTAVNEGTIMLLLDLQTPSFTSAKGAGLQVKLGATATPPPCASATDMACRGHLAGNATFTLSPSSPTDAGVTGKVVGGTFQGGPGNISLEIALGGAAPVRLDLIGARAEASGMTEAGIETVKVAGGLPEEDLGTKVIPLIQAQLVPILARDCPNATLPNCTCNNPSTGRTLLTAFDVAPKDCMVSAAEIANNGLIKGTLAPDLMIDGRAAISLGVQAKAVKGEF